MPDQRSLHERPDFGFGCSSSRTRFGDTGLAEPTKHPEVLGHSLLNPARSTSTQSNALYDRCATERRRPGELRERQTCWSGGVRAEGERRTPPTLVADQRCIEVGWTQEERMAFPLVRAGLVGLGGGEPPTSSLSGIEGSALCGPAFPQVTAERQGRRDTFLATSFQAVQAKRGCSMASSAPG
jgi:hypothetical protein